MIRICKPSVRFRSGKALEFPEWQAEPGFITHLVGANGAGKTTLLDLICAFRRAERGKVELLSRDGKPIPMRVQSLFRNGLGRSFQKPRLFSNYTLDDHLALVGEQLSPLQSEVLGQANISPRKKCNHLSYGQQRLVGSMLAMVVGKRFLLLDEPFAGLDGRVANGMQRLLAELVARKSVSIVVAEHRSDCLPANANVRELEIQ